jgi:hypothetical protein
MSAAHLRRVILFVAFALSISVAGSVAAVDLDQPPASRSNLSDGQLLFDAVFVDGNLVVAEVLVAPDAVIHTDQGDYVGPLGLIAWLETVRGSDADSLTNAEITVVRDLVVIRWQQESDGVVNFGLAHAIIEDGQFSTIRVMDASAIAPYETADQGIVSVASGTMEAVSVVDLTTRDCLVSCIA